MFDNWRVLHGRSAFTGKRRMCGGYSRSHPSSSKERTSKEQDVLTQSTVNRDDWVSKYRMTNP